MIQIFDVALAHFVIEDGKAVALKGIVRLGKINQEALEKHLQLLRDIDPVQEFEGEPEMIIATRSDKWAVRSDLHRLILYDLHKLHLPGLVCTVEKLLQEVNESAAAERRAHLIQAQIGEPGTGFGSSGDLDLRGLRGDAADPVHVPPEIPLRMFLLSGLALVLLCAVGLLFYHGAEPRREEGFEVLERGGEAEMFCRLASGVYMTGPSAGHHGIVVQPEGSFKLFQLHESAPPSFVNAAYRICRKGGRYYLAVNQPGGLVQVIDKDTLEYCAERYKRVQ